MARSCGNCRHFADLPPDWRFASIEGLIAARRPSGMCKYLSLLWADDNRLVCSDGSGRDHAPHCAMYTEKETER